MVSRPSNVVRRRSYLTDVSGYADACSMGIPPRCHASIWSASSDSSVLALPLLEGPKTYSARRAGTGRSRGSHVHHKYTTQVLAAVPRTAPDSNSLAGAGPREHILRGSATRWLTNDSVLDTAAAYEDDRRQSFGCRGITCGCMFVFDGPGGLRIIPPDPIPKQFNGRVAERQFSRFQVRALVGEPISDWKAIKLLSNRGRTS